jgi:hypothetical protein
MLLGNRAAVSEMDQGSQTEARLEADTPSAFRFYGK